MHFFWIFFVNINHDVFFLFSLEDKLVLSHRATLSTGRPFSPVFAEASFHMAPPLALSVLHCWVFLCPVSHLRVLVTFQRSERVVLRAVGGTACTTSCLCSPCGCHAARLVTICSGLERGTCHRSPAALCFSEGVWVCSSWSAGRLVEKVEMVPQLPRRAKCVE